MQIDTRRVIQVKLLASRREAAEALNMPLSTIDELANSGELPSVNIGGRILFPWLDVIRLARVSTVRRSHSKPSVDTGTVAGND